MKLFEFDKSYGVVIGLDEAGRGALAGPVVAASVTFEGMQDFMLEINDSKKLTKIKREYLYNLIKDNSYNQIAYRCNEVIDQFNILNATLLAMRECILSSKNSFDIVLIDGNVKIKNIDFNQEAIVKGDSKSISIAAASILAKVTRDNIMIQLNEKYPEYNFLKNKGYGTKDHIERIKTFGLSPIHRKTFCNNI